jgi:hypothetical protein
MARRIDDSHHTFKRAARIGPGPRKRPRLERTGDWECQKGKNTPTKYVQICTYVGDVKKRRGKKVKVVRSKAKKKIYNKQWRAWAKRSARIKALQKKGPRADYRCRKTPIAKCSK